MALGRHDIVVNVPSQYMNNEFDVIGDQQCRLGEGLCISSDGDYLAWVDIEESTLYVFDRLRRTFATLKLPVIPSKVLTVFRGSLNLLTDRGVLEVSLPGLEQKWLHCWGDLFSSAGLRTNDAVQRKDSLIFGVMAKAQMDGKGAIYELRNGSLNFIDDCEIPNTFIELPDGVLITDSSQKKIYKYSIDLESKALWLNGEKDSFIPDGGVLLTSGNILIAAWGTSRLVELTVEGQKVVDYPLPMKFPTSCVQFENRLYISSAAEIGDDSFYAGKTISIELSL